MLRPGDVVSYLDMGAPFGINLQRAMNFRLLRSSESLILMSVPQGAPYEDRVEQAGRVIVYDGHDTPRTLATPSPKLIDQPEFQPNGRLTQNGLFMEAVRNARSGQAPAEKVRVEKIRNGIWVHNGLFELVAGWQEARGRRQVCKFKLELIDEVDISVLGPSSSVAVEHDRVIPSPIKVDVWKRDGGRSVICGSKENLHFDHIIPYSQGGSSKDSSNIQILCAKHNTGKVDRTL